MDITDFEGLFKYKLIIPILYIISWISMFAGPAFFPDIYQKIAIFLICYLDFKVITLAFVMMYINVKAYQIRKRKVEADANNNPTLIGAEEILFGFIIPNYKEDVEMMAETLEFLAVQRRAKQRYLIFLAMQDHQQGSQLKAYDLIERFKGKFRAMDFTKHEVRQFEQKGKASNVSWCAQHLEPIFQKHAIDPEDVMLTIMDADSWAPQLYFDQLEAYLVKNMERKNEIIFQPPQIFTRNHLDVPVTTRVYDIMHSYAHSTQLFSFFGISFPLSNYTLAYVYAKRFGFWDTCPDAIGEDFHTTQKAFWKTGGDMQAVPIYVPFNQVNIKTDDGYWADVKARFWQGERHAEGVADFAYNLRMFFNNTFRLKNIPLVYNVAETCLLPSVLPWVIISMAYLSNLLYYYIKPSPYLYSDKTMAYLFNILTIFSMISYFSLEFFKRKSNTFIYKQENQSVFRMLEYPLLISFCLFAIGIPGFVLGAFKVLFSQRQYTVAEKKSTTKKKLAEI